MISARKLDQLRSTRSYGIGRLFLLARRDFSSRLAQKMSEKSQDTGGVIPGGSLLPFLDLEGTRSSELARRSGISKQAVAKSLKELEEAGLVTRSQDDSDGRAQIICFTERGVEYLLSIHAAIKSIEQEYEKLLGAAGLQALRKSLSLLAYSETDKR
ncbi:MarR family transcriptional regulator [Bordetella petrii]|nr:MarR family transcriptional regulator [Bordetella petrii]